MNRYQFEDLISEYIENSLSLKKRKEFETYMQAHPESVIKVDEVRQTMKILNSIKKVSVSDNFNDELILKIKEKNNSDNFLPKQSLFGFKPIHASMMTGLFIALFFISFQLIDTLSPVSSPKNNYLVEDSNPILQDANAPQKNLNLSNISEIEDDSTNGDKSPNSKKGLSKKIHFVKD